ncbi:MAG TPA: hypothetical protein VK997_10845 [Deferrisomatales bacterium]|nr:hypothetical protein [Deferrisomatales bacterium]
MEMGGLGRLVQVLSAGLGFFLGYFWVASRWLGTGGEMNRELLRVALGAGGAVSVLYVLLLAGLFWGCIPVPQARSLRVVISPAAFSLSCGLGALGMQGALWVLGCV